MVRSLALASPDGTHRHVRFAARGSPGAARFAGSAPGLPEDDFARMLKLTQELFGPEDPDIARLGEDQSIMNVILDFVNYFSALAGDRRACPTEYLASVIANAEIDG